MWAVGCFPFMANRKRKNKKTSGTHRGHKSRKSIFSSQKMWRVAGCAGAVVALLGGLWVYMGSNQGRRDSLARMLGGEPRTENVTVKPGFGVYGIDLSRYQTHIKWDSLSVNYDMLSRRISATGHSFQSSFPVSFIFIKATQGRWVDPTYVAKRDSALCHGFLCGAYHLFDPRFDDDVQVDIYLKNAKTGAGDLPPVLDMEHDKLSRPYSKLRKRVLYWLQRVEEATGACPLIYCSDKTREDFFATDDFAQYHFWIARYKEDQPRSTDDWLFWQFTDRGSVAGIAGNVDISVWRGSEETLLSWRDSCWKTARPEE